MPRDRVDRARMRDLGARVRELRHGRGLTQERLAETAGVHRAEVGFVERAEREIGYLKIWRLADALDVEPGELFTPPMRPSKIRRRTSSGTT